MALTVYRRKDGRIMVKDGGPVVPLEETFAWAWALAGDYLYCDIETRAVRSTAHYILNERPVAGFADERTAIQSIHS